MQGRVTKGDAIGDGSQDRAKSAGGGGGNGRKTLLAHCCWGARKALGDLPSWFLTSKFKEEKLNSLNVCMIHLTVEIP